MDPSDTLCANSHCWETTTRVALNEWEALGSLMWSNLYQMDFQIITKKSRVGIEFDIRMIESSKPCSGNQAVSISSAKLVSILPVHCTVGKL
jgi:hypothetical protein